MGAWALPWQPEGTASSVPGPGGVGGVAEVSGRAPGLWLFPGHGREVAVRVATAPSAGGRAVRAEERR